MALPSFLLKPSWSSLKKELEHIKTIGKAIFYHEFISTIGGAVAPKSLQVEPESSIRKRIIDCFTGLYVILSHVIWDIIKRCFVLLVAAIGVVFSIFTATLALCWVLIQAALGICMNVLYLLVNNLLIHSIVLGMVYSTVIFLFTLPAVIVDTSIRTLFFVVNDIMVEGIIFGVIANLTLSFIFMLPALFDKSARDMFIEKSRKMVKSFGRAIFYSLKLLILIPRFLSNKHTLQWGTSLKPPFSREQLTVSDGVQKLKSGLSALLEVIKSLTIYLPATLIGSTLLVYNNKQKSSPSVKACTLSRVTPNKDPDEDNRSWCFGFKIHVWSAISEAAKHVVTPLKTCLKYLNYILTLPLFIMLRITQGISLSFLVTEKAALTLPVKATCSIRSLFFKTSGLEKVKKIPRIGDIFSDLPTSPPPNSRR
ncbi:MAG: hypothetical protein VXW87_00895 [Pseudomonadota bacterium]|nr:hypothetical protein [Pseudomonadota bacterium]